MSSHLFNFFEPFFIFLIEMVIFRSFSIRLSSPSRRLPRSRLQRHLRQRDATWRQSGRWGSFFTVRRSGIGRRGEAREETRARWEMTRTIRERKERCHLAATAASLLRRLAPETSFCRRELTGNADASLPKEKKTEEETRSASERFLGRAYFSRRRARLLLPIDNRSDKGGV